MKKLHGVFSLIGFAALSAVTLPAMADSTTEQIGTQSATINGDNNQVIQVINQVDINHPGLGRGLTQNQRRTTVQDSYQGVSVDGSGNSVYQESNQVSVEERSGNPGRRAGHSEGRGQGNGKNKR